MSVTALSQAQRRRFARAPVLASLTIADVALESLVVELLRRHGRPDLAASPHGYAPLSDNRAALIVALSRSLQALLIDYDSLVLQQLMADDATG